MDLVATRERLAIEALTVDETEAIVIYWGAILTVYVADGDLANAAAIAVEVWDEGIRRLMFRLPTCRPCS